MVWSQLDVDQAHIAYAVIGVFTTLFSLCSLFVKEKLYIGEATIAAICGLIVGPHCLNWLDPATWGNSDYITLEISRIVLVVQIFAVAVELPKKYMLKHWLSVFLLLVPVMTVGWLMVGLFIWILIPGMNFSHSLLVSACVTATDPVLAAAVVGKGKFARRVPGHLRNILSAESGCNDGMAFPFIFLSLFLIVHEGNAGEIIKDWVCLTILYECIFGCVLGAILGYCGRHAIKFAERKELIDRESFLAFYIVMAVLCAGFGSILGVDDLLVSFAAGAAFAWDGWFARKTEESQVSTVIDLLLNLTYFVYFGAIIPWEQYNNPVLGLDVWRLVILAFVIIFLRRIPAVMALKPFIPDIKTWREALFCGHFGPVGVGAVFAAILSRKELEHYAGYHDVPLAVLPAPGQEYYQLIQVIWPIVTFVIITSIVVHGSSVAVLTLGRHLNTMVITMSFTKTGDAEGSSQSWLARLPKIDTTGMPFSLQRVDTNMTKVDGVPLLHTNTVETSGVPVKPAGGMARKKRSKKKVTKKKHREAKEAEVIDLGAKHRAPEAEDGPLEKTGSSNSETLGQTPVDELTEEALEVDSDGHVRKPTTVYQEGSTVLIEDQHGEILETLKVSQSRETADEERSRNRRKRAGTIGSGLSPTASANSESQSVGDVSVHSFSSLRRRISQFSEVSESSSSLLKYNSRAKHKTSKVLINKGTKKKVYAFKLDNNIIIENEEGEIVRRYKINPHADVPPGDNVPVGRNRSSSIVNRALSMVGLKQIDPQAPTPVVPLVTKPDTEKAQATNGFFIPGDDERSDASSVPSQRLEDKLVGLLSLEEKTKLAGAQLQQQQPPMVEILEEDSSLESDEDEEDEETAVERARRLTALGEYSAPRDDDDEEELVPTSTIRGSSPRRRSKK
ncbi:hypothetical protein BABINDRAFT_162513 [Babjeviella inositovora NRRL Y-12698]|uniref:Na(+)/H(+) antiporter n=1 Tax=Babjeviella inositovora NRRL Y-12698 TaxID=984486 RepID=A0A1E3QMB0_9ASCO|nr:uncharacterized protein BABINDRAFT_162513 [Babjeviella inositovora NRRL Y-12698]ODQ78833.1 hypothetical protein BABINDRAFT_162513 [Babjeviella inositovora NRRL Y-12698]